MLRFHVMALLFMGAVIGLLFATFGHAEAVEATKSMTAPWWFKIIAENINNYPTLAGWLFAVLAAVNTIFRGLSEILGFVAKKTMTKTDDKIYIWVHGISLMSGTILGWFGVGRPKMVEQVKKEKNG